MDEGETAVSNAIPYRNTIHFYFRQNSQSSLDNFVQVVPKTSPKRKQSFEGESPEKKSRSDLSASSITVESKPNALAPKILFFGNDYESDSPESEKKFTLSDQD